MKTTRSHSPGPRQHGAFAVEFSIILILFLTMVFAAIEISRAIYIWNTLQEVTRRAARAASITDFSDADAMRQLRRAAIFRDSSGTLAFASPITDDHISIEYMTQGTTGAGASWAPVGALPACSGGNRISCSADPDGQNCIRAVRVRICQPNTSCTAVPYEMMLPLVTLNFTIPKSETIVRAQSLGFTPGMPLCQ